MKDPDAVARAPRRALTPTQVVARLATAPGWRLSGDGADVAIEKSFTFPDYHEVIAFVNAVAYIAHCEDHHPELVVGYKNCVVRFETHSVKGLSLNDFICAAKADALVRVAGRP